MRLETQPYSKVRSWTPPAKEDLFGYAGRKMSHQPVAVLAPRKTLFKCPKCIGGAVKEEIDDFQLVLRCVNCGWTKCQLEPEGKHYREEKSHYDKRY